MGAPGFAAMWSWYPSVLLGCAGLAAGYLALVRLRFTRRGLAFFTGVLALLAALVSPLDALGDTYLFSAHMAQHLLLILVVPPLLLVGLPRRIPSTLRSSWERIPKAVRRRARPSPLTAWLLGIGTMWVWHLPGLYNATMSDETLHLVEHLSFLVTSLIFWWPVLGPVKGQRMRSLTAIPYLVLASAATSLLGILLAFAPAGLYPAYLHPADPYGVLALLRDGWGFTPAVDQQAGGLLMWISGGPVYLGGALAALARWYAAAGEDQDKAIGEELHGK